MFTLDRMAIEEAAPDPCAMAKAIHDQLGLKAGRTPIRKIACALDIIKIRTCKLVGIEGALVMDVNRDQGAIAVNSAGSRERRNYTIAHELLHFLNPWHEPPDPERGFACTPADMRVSSAHGASGKSLHFRQEAEANRFAIEVLAPAHLARPCLVGPPDLSQVLRLAKELEISKAAAALRLVELCPEPVAILSTRNGLVQYSRKHPGLPRLLVTRGRQVPDFPQAVNGAGLTRQTEVDPRLWIRGGRDRSLTAQVLPQQNGYAMILLALGGGDG